MDWHKELTANLPPPNEAEPAGLREEIVAELRDHLEYDFRRELISAGNEQTAWQRVRAKFGNPADVALRLWLDAMRGKLIMQKLSVTFSAISAVLGVALIGVLWSVFTTQANLQRESLAEIRRLVDLLPREQALAAVESQLQGDWRRLTLLLESSNGSSDKPFQVVVSSGKVSDSFEIQTDQTHLTETMPAGKCYIGLVSPWGEKRVLETIIGPGRENALTIPVPGKSPAVVEVDFQMTVPELLELEPDDRFVVRILVQPQHRVIENWRWNREDEIVVVELDQQGRILDAKSTTLPSAPTWSMIESVATEPLTLPSGQFTISAIAVARPSLDSGDTQWAYSRPYLFSGGETLGNYGSDGFISNSQQIFSSTGVEGKRFVADGKERLTVTITIPDQHDFGSNDDSELRLVHPFDMSNNYYGNGGAGGGGFF